MATPTRVYYNSLALYASQTASATGVQTGAGSIAEITRATDFSDSWTRDLTNVTVFGNLAPLDRLDLQAPTVNGSFTYFPTNGVNERVIGLTVSSGTQPLVSCISGILSKTTDEKDYYLLVTEQGSDAANYAGSYSGVIGLGNAFITNYTVNIAVGQLVTSAVEVEALNWAVYANADGTNNVPAIDPSTGFPITGATFVLPQYTTNQTAGQVAALQYGDAILNITGDFGFGPTSNNYNIQSATITVPLSRTPIQRLGSKYPFAREPNFPVICNLAIEAEITGISSKNLANILCEGPQDITIRVNNPFCGGPSPTAGMIYVAKGCKVTSLNETNTIGANSTVSVTYEMALGSSAQTGIGIFISGSFL